MFNLVEPPENIKSQQRQDPVMAENKYRVYAKYNVMRSEVPHPPFEETTK